MKKSLLIVLMFLVGGVLFAQEQILNSFDAEQADTNYWQFFDNQGGQHYQTSFNADSALGWINITYPGTDVAEGTGAMRLDYSAQNIESWGGYTKLEHWNPDSNGVYDWSLYDTLSVWYNNITPQDLTGRVHLRVNLHDVSDIDGYKAYDVGETEYYYSFQYILDNEPGWNRIDIPLVNNYNWDGMGFNLTMWSGIGGNSVLDKDKIKGYSFEFSINGAGDGDYAQGSILLDKLHLRGVTERPWLIFNGKTVNSDLTPFTWGQSALEVIEGGGIDPKTNALLWTQGDEWANGWSGAGWNVDPHQDLGFRWPYDSLRFALKAETGTNSPIRFQLESANTGVWGSAIDIIADDQWHTYAIALEDMYLTDESKPGFDSTDISVVQFMGEGNATAGKKLYFDFIWTGSPVIDVSAPAAPALVVAAGGEYANLVTWIDVPGETGEVYDVYSSASPITDIKGEGVEIVQLGVAEGLELLDHLLKAPAVDQDVTFYYAVVCRDAAGNESELKASDASVTNTAKGVTVINPTAPASFVADGNLGEWSGMTPFRMFPSDNTGTIVTNQSVDGDVDLSVNAYVAMDSENLYVAFDVEDDIITSDTTKATYLRDACDLFIGLYDWRGPRHTSLKRGVEPDYQLRFYKEAMIIGNVGDTKLGVPGDGNYMFFEKFPSGYTIEAKIPFATLAAAATPDDAVFTPLVGKRINIDFSINDADATGEREGIMTYSPLNEDLSYTSVARWTYTWIGDQFVDVEEESTIPLNYELTQNYPNPFNPTTLIKFSVVKTADVTLKVYNILGQEVATLINGVKNPGVYQVNFDASELSSGMYIYQIQAGEFVTSKKMMLLK